MIRLVVLALLVGCAPAVAPVTEPILELEVGYDLADPSRSGRWVEAGGAQVWVPFESQTQTAAGLAGGN